MSLLISTADGGWEDSGEHQKKGGAEAWEWHFNKAKANVYSNIDLNGKVGFNLWQLALHLPVENQLSLKRQCLLSSHDALPSVSWSLPLKCYLVKLPMAGSKISHHSAEVKFCKELHHAILRLLCSSDRMLQMLTGVIMPYLPLGARWEAWCLEGSLCGVLIFKTSVRNTNRRRELEMKEL